ncbi:MAG TPA: hypothetical protein PLM24_05100 [Methanothrix sp.]|nr:hypothetical protein [Methanothrix sp.]HPJ83964.1 hypothetical protein [Methanothrix sp.]HPR66495.1 hypothetical protein [Methanothrix sp.]
MKKLLLLLALMVVAFSGCVEEKPSPEELKTMMIESVEKVETAAFAVDMDQTVKVVNHSETNRTLQTMTFDTRSVGDGELNVTAHAMKMTMITTTSSEDMGDVVSKMEMYMQGDTMYTNIDGNWTKMPGMPEEMWDQQNQVRTQAELLNASEIELVGSEKVNGEDAYKAKVVPDTETFALILNQQMGSMPLYAMNVTEIFEESEMEWTTWISKESHLPLKNHLSMELTLTADMMGLPVGETGEIEMEVKSDSTVIYSNYNEPVEIVVPEEAMAAPSWLDMLMAMMAQPSDVTLVE